MEGGRVCRLWTSEINPSFRTGSYYDSFSFSAACQAVPVQSLDFRLHKVSVTTAMALFKYVELISGVIVWFSQQVVK